MEFFGGSGPPATPPPPSSDRLNRLAGEIFTKEPADPQDSALALTHKLDAVMAMVSKINRDTTAGGHGGGGGRANRKAAASPKGRRESFGSNAFASAQRRATSTPKPLLLLEGAASALAKKIDETLPLYLGDLVVLRDLESPVARGFASANCATNACGVQVAADGDADPLNYEDYAFQVFPALSYRTQEEIESRKAAASAAGLKSKGSFKITPMSAAESKDDVALLAERATTEMRVNEATIRDVEAGVRRNAVRFGQAYQLRHVKSGLFVCCNKSAAKKDTTCREVALGRGSVAAQFKVLPRFKAQADGSAVHFSHSVLFEAVNLPGMYLHTSRSQNQDEPDGEKHVNELNASATATCYVLRCFGAFKPGSHAFLHTSDSPFRLFHTQSESFLLASCDSEKNDKNPEPRLFEADGDLEELPAHLPYLRPIHRGAHGDAMDPTDPRNFSAKAVWVFENLSRLTSTVVARDEPVRIRHVPSGRYLAVDTESGEPMHEPTGSEAWYRTYLVRDAVTSSDWLSEEWPLGSVADAESLIFFVTGEDEKEPRLPDSDVTVYIEHRRTRKVVDELDGTEVDKELTLFWHATDMVKPSLSGDLKHTDAPSLLSVFSSVRSAQDNYKLMPVTSEATAIHRARAFVPLVKRYAASLCNPSVPPPSPAQAQAAAQLMLEVVAFLNKGRFEHDTRLDWVKKANGMVPAEFAALFDGDPNAVTQGACLDLKLLDAVFAVGLAPYARAARPFAPGGGLDGPKGVQKLVHVVIQRSLLGNPKAQLYFGRRATRPGAPEVPEGAAMSWVDVLKAQLEDGLGPAVTLSKLLNANTVLFKEHAAPPLVNEFVRLIRKLGPQARLIGFFESICTCGGLPIKASQEMVLRMLWRDEATRRGIFLELEAPAEGLARNFSPLKRDPTGAKVDTKTLAARARAAAAMPRPDRYLGKAEAEARGGLAPVYVRWTGADAWATQRQDRLFWGPAQLGRAADGGLDALASQVSPESQLVRVEDLCWVLEPGRLSESVGRYVGAWHDGSLDADAKARFDRQVQLATYFAVELKLLAKMCTGRSYNCINALEPHWPYTSLVSMAANVFLPCAVRAGALDLCRVLYVDRYPQSPNCGRPSLPELLWIYDAAPPGTPPAELLKLSDAAANSGMPLIRPLYLRPTAKHKATASALPAAAMNAEGGHTKLFLLRILANDVVNGFGGLGRMAHDQKALNAMAQAAVEVILNLLSFGFQSTYDKIKALTVGLVRLIDGRSDVQSVAFEGDEDAEEVPFEPLKNRFELTTSSPGVTAVKRIAIDALIQITHFRTQFRLGKLMEAYRQLTLDPRMAKELKRFHRYAAANAEKHYEGPLVQHVYATFERLFMTGDGKALMLEELSGQDMDTVLLDCLMYDDDLLHAKALELLERTYTQRKLLINAISDVILLEHPYFKVPDELARSIQGGSGGSARSKKKGVAGAVLAGIGSGSLDALHGGDESSGFGDYAALSAALAKLVYLVRSTGVWAVSSRIAGPFDYPKYTETLATCDKLVAFLYAPTEPDPAPQSPASGSVAAPGGYTSKQLPAGSAKPKRLSILASLGSPLRKGAANGKLGLDENDDDDEGVLRFQRSPMNKLHQNVLRAMNLQLSLTECLKIDYNISFKGSICSAEDKVESRRMLVATVRRLVECLAIFVQANPANQNAVFSSALPLLRKHMGPLELPPLVDEFANDATLAAKLVKSPGLNTEEVIVECMRGNETLCAEKVPVELFADFGRLLNAEPDPSDSPLLDFFTTACLPRGAGVGSDACTRNQNRALDEFLRPNNANILAAVEGAFGVGGQPMPSRPDKVVELLCATLQSGNHANAGRLQARQITLEVTLDAIARLVDRHDPPQSQASPKAKSPAPAAKLNRGSAHALVVTKSIAEQQLAEDALLGDDFALALFKFFSLQVTCLVVDPWAFRRAVLWRAVVGGCGTLLSSFVRNLDYACDSAGRLEGPDDALPKPVLEATERHTYIREIEGGGGAGASDTPFTGAFGVSCARCSLWVQEAKSGMKRAASCVAGLLVACAVMLEGARSNGAEDWLAGHDDALSGETNPDSLFNLCARLFKRLEPGGRLPKRYVPKDVRDVQDEILAAARRLHLLVMPLTASKDATAAAARGNEETKDEDEFGTQSGRGLVAVGAEASAPAAPAAAAAAPDDDECALAESDEKDNAFLPPRRMLTLFVEAIKTNPKLAIKLQKRRFEFVKVLEGAAARTDPDTHLGKYGDLDDLDGDGVADLAADEDDMEMAERGDGARPRSMLSGVGSALAAAVLSQDKGPEPDQKVLITWPMVVSRLVEFVRVHNFDVDETDAVRAHGVFKTYLMRARSDPKTSRVLMANELRDFQLEYYRQCQVSMNAQGVTRLALTAIATHAAGKAGNAASSAVELLQELLYTGNPAVQRSVLEYVNLDKDARLFKHLKAKLEEATRAVRERNTQVADGFVAMGEDLKRDFAEADRTLRVLQCLVEGHNLLLQNLLRDQPTQSADINLVKLVLEMLAMVGENADLLRRQAKPSLSLLTTTLDFLVECMQGPCPANQLLVVSHEGAMACLKNVLTSPFSPRNAKPDVISVKTKAMLAIAATLEGRKDKMVHKLIVESMDVSVLSAYAMGVGRFLEECRRGVEPWCNDQYERDELAKGAVAGLVALNYAKTEMSAVRVASSLAAAAAAAGAAGAAVGGDKNAARRRKNNLEEKLLASKVASVEVMWHGRIEYVSFPLPVYVKYLSLETRQNFLNEVDLSTNETRMKELLKSASIFSAEMQSIYRLATKSAVYRVMQTNFLTIKKIQYGLVLLLNLNIAMISYGENREGDEGPDDDGDDDGSDGNDEARRRLMDDESARGYASPYAIVTGLEPISRKYYRSFMLTLCLGVPNLLGYMVILLFLLLTQIPIIIREIDNAVEEKAELALEGVETIYRNPGAWSLWFGTLVLNVVFIVIHQAAYPDNQNTFLYFLLIFGINLPWTLTCMRNYVLVPDTKSTRAFCIMYDIVFSRAVIRNQVVMVFCAAFGFIEDPYFTLMLLDIGSISPTVQNLVKSITTPGQQLAIVGYLFAVMVLIYASFGLELFESYFTFGTDDDNDDNPRGCHSVVSCAWLIMYRAVPIGSLEEVLDWTNNRDGDVYLQRFLFDFSFFVIIGIILFNVITGLMVDTFSSLREAAGERADTLANECFVCGFSRTAYDDIGLPSPTFDQHKAKHHFIWNYLFFIQYLDAKDETEYSGVESYVRLLMNAKSMDWIPTRNSYAAQNFGTSLLEGSPEGMAMAAMEERISAKVDGSLAAMAALEKKIDLLTKKVAAK